MRPSRTREILGDGDKPVKRPARGVTKTQSQDKPSVNGKVSVSRIGIFASNWTMPTGYRKVAQVDRSRMSPESSP
jgi:hypothetical protein